jgi:hypothetical protein
MRRQVGIVLAIGIGVGVAALAAFNADARPWKPLKPIRPAARPESFCVSGEFSGRLEGWIVLDGSSLWVAPDATLYEVGGGGGLPVGTMLTAQRVTFSGIIRGDSRIVRQATIRPFGSGGGHEVGESRNVGVLKESAPQ